MKYFLLSLGCQMNTSDGERLAAMLDALGLERVTDEADADLCGAVACSVRQRAVDRVYGRIRAWRERHPRPFTFLSGCLLDGDRERLAGQFDLVFPIERLPELPALLPERFAGAGRGSSSPAGDDSRARHWQIAPQRLSACEAYVPIQNGCDRFCSYCAVPYTRGREVSRAEDEILAEVAGLVKNGYRMITLLGQNVNAYAREAGGRFPELLEKIAGLVESGEGETYVYYTSPHPADMSERLFAVMARHRSLARWLHMPLQAGDDAVLARMNRGYTVADFRRLVAAARASLPGAALVTDLITGFPGETEAEFQGSLAALTEFRFAMAFIALYSPRPGAAASRLADDVPPAEKKRRLHRLTDELRRITLEENTALIGTRVRALVQGPGRLPGLLAGRTLGLLPIEFSSNDESLVGRFLDVEVTTATPMALAGVPVAGTAGC